jgi:hypothetical protein
LIIKCFSLTEPWATAVRLNLKCNETRGKKTSYRGWLAIASTKEVFDRTKYNTNWNAYIQSLGLLPQLHYGVVHCIVKLTHCIPTEDFNISTLTFDELQLGYYGPKRHVWVTDNLIQLPKFYPVIGKQWLFDWEVPKEIEHLLI